MSYWWWGVFNIDRCIC